MKQWQQELLAQLMAPDADGTAIRSLVTANLPPRICKYRAVSDYSLGNLETSTVWLDSPLKLNDLNECRTVVRQDEIFLSNIRSRFESAPEWAPIRALVDPAKLRDCIFSDTPVHAMVLAACAGDSMFSELQLQELAQSIELAVREQLIDMEREVTEAIRSGIRICSFGTDSFNQLMWAHYADDHRGFCLEWDLSIKDPQSPVQEHLFPVVYLDEPLDLTDAFLAATREESLPSLVGVAAAIRKQIQWEYEAEWRLAFPLGPEVPAGNYSMPSPAAVYLGARMSDEDAARVRAVAEGHSIQVFRMRLGARDFSLHAEPAS